MVAETGGPWAGVLHLAWCCPRSAGVSGELLLPLWRLPALVCVLAGADEQRPFGEQPREV